MGLTDGDIMAKKQKTTSLAGDEKLLGVLSYLGILVLVPLLLRTESAFVKAHMKQGLMLLLVSVVNSFLAALVITLPLVLLIAFAVLICSIMGIVKVLQGQTWEVPVVGKYASDWNL